MSDSDPGWGKPKDMALGAFAPQLALRRKDLAALAEVRTLFISFSSSLVMIGVVVLLLFPPGSSSGAAGSDVAVACAIVAVFSAGALLAARLVRPTLPCGTESEILDAYRSRFFVRMAFNNSAALAGFVACFLIDSPVPYAVGLLVGIVGHVMTAPTNAHLRAEDELLRAKGCENTLTGALGMSPGTTNPIS